MTRGHPDYWSAVQVSIGKFMSGITPWHLSDSLSVDALAVESADLYVVPAGKTLNIVGGALFCNFPVTQQVWLYWGEVGPTTLLGMIFFSSYLVFPSHPMASMRVQESIPVGWQCTNMHDNSVTFYINLIGYLEDN